MKRSSMKRSSKRQLSVLQNLAAWPPGRLIAVGRLANGVIAVVFVTLGAEGISVISMRPVSRKEGKRVDG